MSLREEVAKLRSTVAELLNRPEIAEPRAKREATKRHREAMAAHRAEMKRAEQDRERAEQKARAARVRKMSEAMRGTHVRVTGDWSSRDPIPLADDIDGEPQHLVIDSTCRRGPRGAVYPVEVFSKIAAVDEVGEAIANGWLVVHSMPLNWASSLDAAELGEHEPCRARADLG